MKRTLSTKMRYTLYTVLCAVLASIFFYKKGYNQGWHQGADEGVTVVLDTVNTILQGQKNSDSSVTRLILINADTNSYIISRKTVLSK